MKLLKVTASHFKKCCDDFTIDFVAISKKTAEDKEYELLEIAPELYVYNTMAFVGKNASGKSTAVELLDCCYTILGEFRLSDKHYPYDGVRLSIWFFHENYLYLYETELVSGTTVGNQAVFRNEHIYRKKYFKSNIKQIYDREGYKEMHFAGDLPEDTSYLFFVLKKKSTAAVFFDSYSGGLDTYRLLFRSIKNYGIDTEELGKIIRVFDESLVELVQLDEHNYRLTTKTGSMIMPDAQLLYYLSSGTTKGLLLYVMMAASLKNGFDLLVDEIENHFHKTLVENMLSLYKDKEINKKNASLVFTTHYSEILDLMGRQDSIWICRSDDGVCLSNMYEDYQIRSGLLKSRQFSNNEFGTAVNYDFLMDLKKVLRQ